MRTIVELVDATVNFHDLATGKNVAGARTHTSASSNPRKFVLTPGTYTVKFVSLGAHQGHQGSFEVTVEPGKTVEQVGQLQ
jgi:hypothetical protein